MTTPQAMIPKGKIEDTTPEGLKQKLEQGGLPKEEASKVVDGIVGANIQNPRMKAINERMMVIKKDQEHNRQLIKAHQDAIDQLVMTIAVQEGGIKDCAYWMAEEEKAIAAENKAKEKK